MVTQVNVESEILNLKKQLELMAKEHDYNFQHPRVIALSEELDKLIILVMRNRWHTTSV